MEYLGRGEDFTDMVTKPNPNDTKYPLAGDFQPCHVCKQHGGWNLRLNAYGEGKHFRASCSQCWGWGWVQAGSLNATCPAHEWGEKRVSMHVHKWTCKHCGFSREVDSSG